MCENLKSASILWLRDLDFTLHLYRTVRDVDGADVGCVHVGQWEGVLIVSS
jgi:hypothetical protein